MTGGDNRCNLALIGFGEAGGILAAGFVAARQYRVTAYDILLDEPATAAAMRERMLRIGAEPCETFAAATAGAAIVISAVTASAAYEVAASGGRHLRAGQIFLDINSVSPASKRRNAGAVEGSGAAYVEAAVMAPVPPSGMRVPILLGGAKAGEAKRLLDPAGMNLEIGDAEIGRASATKMCRSIMIKGLEALVVECLQTARQYGVEDSVLASLGKSYPGIDWQTQVGYLLGRVLQHGRRRAAEMREAAATVAETGLTPLLATAIAGRQQAVADLVAAAPDLKTTSDADWRLALDRLADQAGLGRPLGPG